MRTKPVALLAAVVAVAAVPARASTPPAGRRCAFTSSLAPTTERQDGAMYLGPLAITSTDPDVRAWCQIYVTGVAAPGARVDATVVPVGAGEYVAAGVAPIDYAATAGDSVEVCTFAHFDGKDWYWHPASGIVNGLTGTWDDRPFWGDCNVLPPADPNPDACPALLTVDKYAGTGLADIWQDCEPYDPIL